MSDDVDPSHPPPPSAPKVVPAPPLGDATADGWLGSAPAWSGIAPAHDAPLVEGDGFGGQAGDGPRYVRGRLLGRGGMGEVRAAQDRRLDREVAIKTALTAGELEQRLVREGRIAARLEHPGVVPVLDAGRDEEGRAWYAMQLLKGRSLAEVLKDGPDRAARLALVRQVLQAAEAIAYAHAQGIIHRDLKPANLVVGAFGVCQVVDWGLARGLDEAPSAPDAARTVEGAVLGTPAYMSPEQAAGLSVDTRADVWSLGAVLFEVLTGEPPFGRAAVGDGQSVLRRVLASDVPDPRALAEWVPPELAAIVRRAMCRDLDQRYADGAQLARDLSRWLTGERVQAHAYSGTELLARRLQRWRQAVFTGGAVLSLALAIVSMLLWQTSQAEGAARQSAGEAAARSVEAQQLLARALTVQAWSEASKGNRSVAEGLAVEALGSADSPEVRGVLMATGLQPRPTLLSRVSVTATGTWTTVPGDDNQDLVLHSLSDRVEGWQRVGGDPMRRLWSLPIPPSQVSSAGEGEMVVMQQEGIRMPHLVQARDGALMRRLNAPGGLAGRVGPSLRSGAFPMTDWGIFVFSRAEPVTVRTRIDHPQVVAAAMDADAGVHWVDADGRVWGAVPHTLDPLPEGPDGWRDAGEPIETGLVREHVSTRFYWVEGHDDRSLAVVAGLRGAVVLVDLTRRELLLRIDSPTLGTARAVALSPDGKRLAVSGDLNQTEVWSVETGQRLVRLPAAVSTAVGWDGPRTLWRLGHALEVWSLPDGAYPVVFDLGLGMSDAVVLPAVGEVVAAAGNGTLVRADLRTGARLPPVVVAPENRVVKSLALVEDQVLLAGVSSAPSVEVTFRSGQDPIVQRSDNLVGVRRLAKTSSGELFVGDLALLGARRIVQGPQGWTLVPGCSTCQAGSSIMDMSVQPGGRSIATLDNVGQISVLAPQGTTWARTDVVIDRRVRSVGMSADAESIYAPVPGRLLRLHRASGEVIAQAQTGTQAVYDVAASADGRWVALGHRDGTVRVLAADSLALVALTPPSTERISKIRFLPDGRTLLTASWDDTVRLWDLSVLTADVATLKASYGDSWGWGPRNRPSSLQ